MPLRTFYESLKSPIFLFDILLNGIIEFIFLLSY